MIIESRGIVYDATHRARSERIAFFPSLCVLRSGAILAGYQIGSQKHAPDGTIRLSRSDDGGLTWQEIPFQFETTRHGVAGSLAAVELVEVEPQRLLLFSTWFDRSDPDRPLFDPVTEGILKSRQVMAISTDGGHTWSSWRELATPGLTGCATTGPVLQWSNGTLAYAFESFKEFDDPKPARHAAWLLISYDGGETFEPPRKVAQHPQHTLYYWDQRLCPAVESGSFIGLFWTHDLAAKRDRPVHWFQSSIYDPDESKLPLQTTIPGQIAAPLLLDDQRLLAFVVNRESPGTLTLWLSPDGGQTWPQESHWVVHRHLELAQLTQGQDNIDFKAYWEDMGKWSFGHPVIRRLPDGKILLGYYAGTPDSMSIHWVRAQI
jgi:hypothetical protein